MKRLRLSLLFLVLLFSALFIMRFVHLAADPPPDLSSSMGYMSDPGGYNINARNKIVFGSWEMDMWNTMHISPLPHSLRYLIFLILGTGIAQMNLVPVIFGCFTLVIVYLVFRKTIPLVSPCWESSCSGRTTSSRCSAASRSGSCPCCSLPCWLYFF